MDLEKVKVGTLLGVGIAGIVGLMVVTTTYLSYLSTSTQDIIESSTTRIFDVLTIQRDTDELFSKLEDVRIMQTQDEITAARDEYGALLERAKKTIERGEEEEIFVEAEVMQAEKVFEDVSDLAERIFAMKEETIGQRTKSDTGFEGFDNREAVELGREFENIRHVGFEMSALVQNVIIRSDGEFEGAMDLVQRSQIITWVVVGVSVVLALVLGYFIVRFAKRAYDIKNEFIYVISHDLRNPVVAILGYIQLITTTKNLSREQMRESLQAIEVSAQRLRTQIANMLEVGRTDTGFVKLNLDSVQAAQVIEESVMRAKALAEVNGMKIGYEKPAGKEVYVLADKSKLSDVLDNLISNALKYNREKGVVTISTEDAGELFRVSVADTGYGIAEDQRDKLFKKYSRLQAKSEKGVGGTGLGLYTAKLSMEKMEGTISFESVVDKGTIFTVSLKKAAKKTEE